MGPERRAANRDDVARLAGVSPSAVSLVLNGKAKEARLSAETRERVLVAARQLNYFPHGAGRALAKRRHRAIGVIASPPPGGPHLPVFEDFAIAVIDRAASHEHFVTFLPAVSPPGDYDALAVLRGAAIDGVIVYGDQNVQQVGQTLVQVGIPLVVVGTQDLPTMPPGVGIVIADQYSGGQAVGRYFADHGHRQVGVLIGTGQEPPQLGQRFRGFFDGLTAEMTTTIAVAARWGVREGRQAMGDLLARAPALSAVFAGNDPLAIGAIRTLREAGRQVPDDVAVAGFGNFRLSRYLDPPLTTVHWPLAELGRRAVDLLVDHLAGGSLPEAPVVLPTRLILRESTEKLRSADGVLPSERREVITRE